MRARRRWLGLALALIAAGGCAPQYDTVKIRARSGGPGARAGLDGLELRHGEVLVFEVRPQAVGDPVTEVTMEVELESIDRETAVVRPTIMSDTWAVSGARVGTTAMNVFVDGELRETVEIVVEPEQVQ